MRASGTRRLHDENPKIRTDSDISHTDSGGLSTVIEPAMSAEPKKNAFQESAPAWAAAA